MKKGSCGGMWKPSPKLPSAIFGCSTLIASIMQSLMRGSDRRQIGIVGAVNYKVLFMLIFIRVTGFGARGF
jgi:hypothetical protein